MTIHPNFSLNKSEEASLRDRSDKSLGADGFFRNLIAAEQAATPEDNIRRWKSEMETAKPEDPDFEPIGRGISVWEYIIEEETNGAKIHPDLRAWAKEKARESINKMMDFAIDPAEDPISRRSGRYYVSLAKKSGIDVPEEKMRKIYDNAIKGALETGDYFTAKDRLAEARSLGIQYFRPYKIFTVLS